MTTAEVHPATLAAREWLAEDLDAEVIAAMDRWTGRDHGDNAFAARITETWQTTRIPGSSVSEVDLLALAWFLATAPGMVARLLDGQGRKVARVFEAATRRKR